MSLLALCGRRVQVRRGDRVFVVRPPTVATVVVALATLRDEITAIAKAAKEVPGILDRDSWVATLSPAVTVGSATAIGAALETCISVIGGAPGDVEAAVLEDHGLRLELVVAVFSLTSLQKLLPDETARAVLTESTREPEGQSFEDSIYAAASVLGVPPHELADWPFEVFLRALEVEAERHEARGNGESAGVAGDGVQRVSVEELASTFEGFGYTKVD